MGKDLAAPFADPLQWQGQSIVDPERELFGAAERGDEAVAAGVDTVLSRSDPGGSDDRQAAGEGLLDRYSPELFTDGVDEKVRGRVEGRQPGIRDVAGKTDPGVALVA